MSRDGKIIVAATFGIALAYCGLWIGVSAFTVGWPPPPAYEDITQIERISDYDPSTGKKVFSLSVDGRRVRRIGSRVINGFIDWHYAYRIECEPEVMNALVSAFRMEPGPDPDLRSGFREVFPEAADCLERGVAVSASPEFSHIGRGGGDGDHFSALYDEKTSRLYLWAHFNF